MDNETAAIIACQLASTGKITGKVLPILKIEGNPRIEKMHETYAEMLERGLLTIKKDENARNIIWLTEAGYKKYSDNMWELFDRVNNKRQRYPKVDTHRKYKLRLLWSVRTGHEWTPDSKLKF